MNNDLSIKIVCFVTCIVIPTLMGGVCVWFRKRWKRPHYPADGELLMRYGLPARFFGLFTAFVFPATICIIGVLAPPKEWIDVLFAGASLLLSLGMGIPIFVETHYRWLLVSSKGIALHSPWRGERYYGWEDILECIAMRQRGAFLFRGRDGSKFKVTPILSGIREFVPYLMRYLDPAVGRQAHRVILQLGLMGILDHTEDSLPNDLPDIARPIKARGDDSEQNRAEPNASADQARDSRFIAS
jgi:hypothetical protein